MDFDALNREIVACDRCPRLREWCTRVASERRKSFEDWEYWGRPVPNFGDPEAKGLIVGLAPAAHGANRTGRMFTGDRSGDWLFRALCRAGLANQPESVSAGDGLQLNGCLITAVCHCAPPDNKPTRAEVTQCHVWLQSTWELQDWKAVLCLGGIAWSEVLGLLGQKRPRFGHGAEVGIEPTKATAAGPVVLASYHPSQQNTFTGRLTEPMLDEVVGRFASLIRA